MDDDTRSTTHIVRTKKSVLALFLSLIRTDRTITFPGIPMTVTRAIKQMKVYLVHSKTSPSVVVFTNVLFSMVMELNLNLSMNF
jgi:hypothetical protein